MHVQTLSLMVGIMVSIIRAWQDEHRSPAMILMIIANSKTHKRQ